MTQSSDCALDTKCQWQWNSPALSRKNAPFAKSELKMQTWIFPKQVLHELSISRHYRQLQYTVCDIAHLKMLFSVLYLMVTSPWQNGLDTAEPW